MTQELQAELHQGVLVRFFGGFYVAADADGQEYTLRCPKKFRHQRLSPLVGDAVRFTPGQGEEEGWLVEILPRKTECIRPPVANVTLTAARCSPKCRRSIAGRTARCWVSARGTRKGWIAFGR